MLNNSTKIMLETIQEQAKTIHDLTRQVEILNEIRHDKHNEIAELKKEIEKIKEETKWRTSMRMGLYKF